MAEGKTKVNKIQAGELGLTLVANMSQITLNRIGDYGINNAHKNLKHLGKCCSLKGLRNVPSPEVTPLAKG
jgi:hypothetical protein